MQTFISIAIFLVPVWLMMKLEFPERVVRRPGLVSP